VFERVLPRFAFDVLVGDAFAEAVPREPIDKRKLSARDVVDDARDRGEIVRLRQRRFLRRAMLPALEPQPFGPGDVRERVLDGAEAAAALAIEGVRGNRAAGVDDAAVRPAVVSVQLADFVCVQRAFFNRAIWPE